MSGTGLKSLTITLLSGFWMVCSVFGVMSLPVSADTIAQAKLSPNGAGVYLEAKTVIYTNQTCFYIEEDDRSSGIRVNYNNAGFTSGTKVNILGVLSTDTNGERAIQAFTVDIHGTGSISPLVMTISRLGERTGTSILRVVPVKRGCPELRG